MYLGVVGMRRRTLTSAVALASAICVSSPSSYATTLTLSPAASLFNAGNIFYLAGLGVDASVGGNPISPSSLYGPPIGVATGSMDLTLVGSGEADVRFSVSLFSDENPYVLTGTYAPWGVPVVLRINEISFEVPALSDPPARVGSQGLNSPSTASIRGSLTVGTTTVPFSDTQSGCCPYRDALPPGYGLDFAVSPNRVVIGFGGGPGLLASFGVGFPSQDLITLNGVTFSTRGIAPYFYDLLYVPEPNSTLLLAVVTASLLLLRAKGRGLRRAKRPPG